MVSRISAYGVPLAPKQCGTEWEPRLFHITIAIARFFEILLFDMAKSIAGLVALALAIVLGCIGGVAGVRKLGRMFMK